MLTTLNLKWCTAPTVPRYSKWKTVNSIMKPTIETLSACLISIALAGCGDSDSSPIDPLPESAGAPHAAPANTGHTETSVTPASNQSLVHSQDRVTSSPVETSARQPDAEPASPLAGAIRPVLGFPGCFVDRGVCWLCDLKW
jgi:hypothetical protein